MSTPTSLRGTLVTGFGLALGLTLFIDFAILVVPIYDMQLYDRVLMSHNMNTLAMLSVACVVGLLFYAALDYLRSACFIAIANIVARRLHGPALDEGIRRAAAGDRRVGPQLVRDVNELQSFLGSGAVAVPLDAICVPMFLAILYMLHPAFFYLTIAGIAAMLFAGALTEWLVHPPLKHAQERRRAADHALSRSLAETELTEGLGMLPAIARRWCDRYADAVLGLTKAATNAQITAGLSRLVRLIMQAGVMVLGAILIIRGDTTPGSLMGANLLLNKSLLPFDHLVDSCRSWFNARQAWRGVAQLLSWRGPSEQPQCPLEGADPGLLVCDAQLRLPNGRVLLNDISLRVAPGTLAVVVGPNGGGKTTLLRMLAGVAPPSRGTILLDGMPIAGGPEIGYLPQSVSLMDGTLSENIGRMQPELDRVIDTARRANVHELIGRMARGYETELVGDGKSLSGGMRQRIGLARALYGEPRLLLLDEPDASLDAEGSKALIEALRDACAQGAIALVISHRPAMQQEADLVIELRDGRVVSRAAPVTQKTQLQRA